MRYGLSLTECIDDMAKGDRNPNFVIQLVTGTAIDLDDPEVVEGIIAKHTAPDGVWADEPEKCEAIFRRFIAEGKIQQPRKTIGKVPHIGDGRWVDSIDDIRWLPFLEAGSSDTLTV